MTVTTLEDLERWDRECVWHSFTQMAEYEPLLIERGERCTLYDARGQAYLDGVSSLWCNVHGHRHPRLDAALRDQLDRIAHTTFLGASNSTTVRLARRLTELAPPGLGHVFFSSDGASAVEAALKIAFQYWRQCDRPRPEKTCFLALADAYHGDTIGGVSVSGVDQFSAMFKPLLFETIRVPPPHPYGLPPEALGDDRGVSWCLARLEETLAREHARIAAMVVEPLVQGAAGMWVHASGYLRGVRELTSRYGVLLIADEVAVGFGRTGKMFACEHEGVSPDILCLGKGLAGGYLPMAATLATDEIWRAFLGPHAASRQLFHGHTFGGNPLAAAVALASLEVFEEDRVFEKLPGKIGKLRDRLRRLVDHPHVGDVRQCGLLAGIELVRDRAAKTPFPAIERRGWQVCRRVRERGVLLRPLGDVLVIMPPLAIVEAEIDCILDAIEAELDGATA